MFLGLLKSKLFRDGQLGEFRRSGGYWKSQIAFLPYGTFRLAVAGNRTRPDQAALNLANELQERFGSLIPEIQRGLFDHYSPYREAAISGEETGSPCPDIAKPEESALTLRPRISWSNRSMGFGQ